MTLIFKHISTMPMILALLFFNNATQAKELSFVSKFMQVVQIPNNWVIDKSGHGSIANSRNPALWGYFASARDKNSTAGITLHSIQVDSFDKGFEAQLAIMEELFQKNAIFHEKPPSKSERNDTDPWNSWVEVSGEVSVDKVVRQTFSTLILFSVVEVSGKLRPERAIIVFCYKNVDSRDTISCSNLRPRVKYKYAGDPKRY